MTLVPSLQKVEERWEQCKEYYLVYLPSRKKFDETIAANKRYVRIKYNFLKKNFTRSNCISHQCQHPIHQFSEVFLESQTTYTYCIQRDEEPYVDSDEKIHESRGCHQENRKEASKDSSKENQLPDKSTVVGAKSERLCYRERLSGAG